MWQGQMGWPRSWAEQDQPGPRGSRGAKAEGVPSKAGAPAGNIAYEGQQASQGPIHVALETDLPLCTGPGLGLPLGVWEEDGTGMGDAPGTSQEPCLGPHVPTPDPKLRDVPSNKANEISRRFSTLAWPSDAG